MKLSQVSTQTLINTALYILYEERRVKQKALLEKLKQHYDLQISQAHFSKAYTLYQKEGVLHQRKSVLAKERLESLLSALKQLLKKELGIDVSEQEGEVVFTCKTQKWQVVKGILDLNETSHESKELLHTHDKLELYRKTELFEKAKNIDILASYFTALPVLLEQLKIAIEKNGCMVRILMLDPYQDVIRQRAKDLSVAGENPMEIAAMQAEKLRDFARMYPGKVEFYLYNVLPVFSIIRFDNKMFIGYQWFSRVAGDGAYQEYQLDVPAPSPFIKNIQEHWEKLWNHAQSWKDINQYSYRFICYVEKDQHIHSMELRVNPKNNNAILIDESSKVDYYGTLYNLGANIAVMNMQAENLLWSITFYLNAPLDKFNLQELVTGICTIHSPEDREILSRRIVLVKVNAMKKTLLPAEERSKILSNYLTTMKTIHAANWQSLKRWIEGRGI